MEALTKDMPSDRRAELAALSDFEKCVSSSSSSSFSSCSSTATVYHHAVSSDADRC